MEVSSRSRPSIIASIYICPCIFMSRVVQVYQMYTVCDGISCTHLCTTDISEYLHFLRCTYPGVQLRNANIYIYKLSKVQYTRADRRRLSGGSPLPSRHSLIDFHCEEAEAKRRVPVPSAIRDRIKIQPLTDQVCISTLDYCQLQYPGMHVRPRASR